jgi:outer membrane murein-binding lipoprotein Lpp
METILIAGAVGLAVGFILGVLVGRRNTKLVNTVIADVKALEAKLEALDKKTVKVAVPPVVVPVAAVTGSK